MTRKRRRLLAVVVPITLLLIVVLVKSLSVVIAGGAAPADFAGRDTGALRGDVAALTVLDIGEPAKTFFSGGTLAVLEDRLDDAVEQFTGSLARTDPDQSCPARVNLEIVQETLGDRAFQKLNGPTAVDWFVRAGTVVDQAPDCCFAGNDDSDEERRAVRDEAASRLAGKIDAARTAPPPPPPPAAESASPPPAPPTEAVPADQDTQARLEPGSGDPLERLQQILRDAAAAAPRR